jgi:hypothetical protein
MMIYILELVQEIINGLIVYKGVIFYIIWLIYHDYITTFIYVINELIIN